MERDVRKGWMRGGWNRSLTLQAPEHPPVSSSSIRGALGPQLCRQLLRQALLSLCSSQVTWTTPESPPARLQSETLD